MARIETNGTLLLDEPCWSCSEGKNTRWFLPDEHGNCSICDGSGHTLTNAGEELIDFIRRHKNKIFGDA